MELVEKNERTKKRKTHPCHPERTTIINWRPIFVLRGKKAREVKKSGEGGGGGGGGVREERVGGRDGEGTSLSPCFFSSQNKNSKTVSLTPVR